MNVSSASKDGSTQSNKEIAGSVFTTDYPKFSSNTDEPRSSSNADKSTSLLWLPYVCLSLCILLVFFLSFLRHHWQVRIKRNVKLSPTDEAQDDSENPGPKPAYKTKKVNSSVKSKQQAETKGDSAESKTIALPLTDRLKMLNSAENGSDDKDKKGMSFLDKIKAQIAKEENENNRLANSSSADSGSSLLIKINDQEISSKKEESMNTSEGDNGEMATGADTTDNPKTGTCSSDSTDLSKNENTSQGNLAATSSHTSCPVLLSERLSELKEVSNQSEHKQEVTKDSEIVAACEDIAWRKQSKRVGKKPKSSDVNVFTDESNSEITNCESISSSRNSPDLPPLQETFSRCSSSSSLSPLPPIVERSKRFSKGASLQSLFEIEECGINGVPDKQTSFRFPPVRNRRSLVEID